MSEFEPEHLARLIELSDDLICVGGADGYFFRVSPSWMRVLGYTEEELRARPFLEFVHPDDQRSTAFEVRRVFRGARSRQFPNRIRHRDGHYRWLRWNVSPAHDTRYAYAVARDVTDLQLATQRLQEQTDLLRATEQRLAKELAHARDVQLAFIPSEMIALSWAQVAGQCLPAREVSGDFADWYELPGDRLAITAGDVMGKGVPAALLMSTTQTLLRATVQGGDRAGSVDPSAQIARTNEALHSSLGSAERFVTVFSGQLGRDGELLFADAGHGHALIRRHSGTFEGLEATGLPLGVDPGAVYPNERRHLDPGDVLLVATDGFRDMLESVDDGPWTARIEEAVSDWSSAAVIVNDLVLWAESVTEGAGAEDDLTVAAVVYSGAGREIHRPSPSQGFEADVPPRLEALALLEERARSLFAEAGVTPAVGEELVLGLHEILANVVTYAGPASAVSVLVEVRSEHLDSTVEGFTVEVATRDDGREYVGTTSRRRALERGRGLAICRATFDIVEHRRDGESNLWVLYRHVASAPGTTISGIGRSSPMTDLEVTREPGHTVVNLHGRFDIAAIEELRPRLLEAAAETEGRMVVRMGDVSFLDSTGVGMLVALQKLLAYQGKFLLLTELQPQARMVLRITHLEWILTCFDAFEEAVAA